MISDFILDIVFPKFCLGCQKEGFYVCGNCLEKIKINDFSTCYLCGKHTLDNRVCDICAKKTSLDCLLMAGSWEDLLLRQMIYEYKYRFINELSNELSKTLINYLDKYYTTLINNDNIALFVPVPLHYKRLYWRGFNQASLLAQKVANHFNLPVIDLIERARNTLPQAEIKSQKYRKSNISQAFHLKQGAGPKNPINGKIIILIDDICTTGATLEECAKVLKPLKPKEIWGLVLARG